ncbi:MAG: DUF420 domain-containing protein [Spirochaetes bacterium]|nr:DUF420 domain-containing protein [Spirochaetota bacterium]
MNGKAGGIVWRRRAIIGLSIAVPLAVAALFRVHLPGHDLSFLPPIYAGINGVTALLLIAAVWAVRHGRRSLHQGLMKTCIGLSASFLAMYVAYHMTSETTHYGGVGPARAVYFFILITHIAFSTAITPLVLLTFSRALDGRFDRHKALARFTFPIWLYTSVTGVVVYWMIRPYYH